MNLADGWIIDTVRANGIDLRYYRTGDGPPLVMAHGFYDNGRRWIPLANDLANQYDVVTYDARGHGHSDAPETGYSIEDRVADLVGVVNELNLENPILFGHSMGGSTAAWTAATHPTLLRALVLEDPAGMYGEPDITPEERVQIVHETLEDRANRWTAEEIEEEYDDLDPDQARRLAVADTECSTHITEIAREGYPPLENAFTEIACPTLVLKADADTKRRVTDLEIAETLANGRLVHIPNAGHYIFRDEYDAAYSELRAFLQQLQN